MASTSTTEVAVQVSGVGRRSGLVQVALCTGEEFVVGRCRRTIRVQAADGSALARFTDVPTGTYAVLALHDVYGYGRVRTGLFGIPRQGVGFSRNPSLFGKPRFEQVAQLVAGRFVEIRVRLKFEPWQ